MQVKVPLRGGILCLTALAKFVSLQHLQGAFVHAPVLLGVRQYSKSTEAVIVTLHGKEDFANVTKPKVLRLGGCHAIPRWALHANQLPS